MKGTQLLNAQLNVEETNTESKEYKKLIEYEKIEGAPFDMIKQDEEYFVAIGNNMLTSKHSTWEGAIEELDERKWEIILNLIVIVAGKMKEEDNNNKNQQK